MTEVTHARKYRTFWPRFWAGIIDGLILWPLDLVDRFIWASVTAPAALVVWFVLYSFSFVAYTIVLHGLYGQTIGKRLMGVKVVDVSESKLSMRQALLRDSVILALIFLSLIVDLPVVATGSSPYVDTAQLNGVQWASVYASLAWFVLELVTMLSNPKRRAVHDLIASSVVIRLDDAKPQNEPALGA